MYVLRWEFQKKKKFQTRFRKHIEKYENLTNQRAYVYSSKRAYLDFYVIFSFV